MFAWAQKEEFNQFSIHTFKVQRSAQNTLLHSCYETETYCSK